jgi:putative copper resistance protein D
MDLFNVAFFMGGGLFWWPTVGLDATTHWKLPFAGRLGNLFLGIPFESFLGIALMNNSRPVAPMYTVADTHAGGSVLWAVTELFTLAGLFMVMGQWMKAEERAAAREDRRLDALEEAARAQADGEIPAAAEPFGQFSQN